MVKSKFIDISKYIHGYFVTGLHDLLTAHKEEIDAQFHEEKGKIGYNVPLRRDKLWLNLRDIHESVFSNFYLFQEKFCPMDSDFSVYKQTNEKWSRPDHLPPHKVWHNHIEDSTITSVCYLDPPKDGGELSLFMCGAKEKIKPVKDIIYTFPSWILHKPEAQKDKTPRYSINWGKYSFHKVVHKVTGDLW